MKRIKTLDIGMLARCEREWWPRYSDEYCYADLGGGTAYLSPQRFRYIADVLTEGWYDWDWRCYSFDGAMRGWCLSSAIPITPETLIWWDLEVARDGPRRSGLAYPRRLHQLLTLPPQ